MTPDPDCPFCSIAQGPGHDRRLLENSLGVVVRDAFPVTDGHTLIIPRRHVPSFFDVNPEEREALLSLLDAAKQGLDEAFGPDAFNIGINDGPAAGQTVAHLHIHLIPRYGDEGGDPRGGVRWVVPGKADYWSGGLEVLG